MSVADLSDVRSVLRAISAKVGDGYLVSCAFDGSLMRIQVGRDARLGNWRKPWVMTLDSEDDYSVDPEALVAQLAEGARAWFGASPSEADEIEKLLKECAAK